MKFPFLKHPTKGTPDVMITLVVVATLAAVVKFLSDGVVLHIAGHIINFGHVDSFSYGSLLAPVFGAHGYMSGSSSNNVASKVDNPDA